MALRTLSLRPGFLYRMAGRVVCFWNELLSRYQILTRNAVAQRPTQMQGALNGRAREHQPESILGGIRTGFSSA
jgi:hypothetical protein